MSKYLSVYWVIFAASLLCSSQAFAQGVLPSGLYKINSGRYAECCGIAGTINYLLPNARQGFVELNVTGNLASMKILASDGQTVFEIPALASRGRFMFSLSNGIVFPDHIQFGSPSPQLPDKPAYNYAVSNSAGSLSISGTLTLPCPSCADVPTEFSHSNVVAGPVPVGPPIEKLERVGDLVRFRFTGPPGNDFFVEFAGTLPATNWLSLTNYRAKIQTITAVVTDSITNRPARFYRIRQQDCQCD